MPIPSPINSNSENRNNNRPSSRPNLLRRQAAGDLSNGNRPVMLSQQTSNLPSLPPGTIIRVTWVPAPPGSTSERIGRVVEVVLPSRR